MNYGQRITLILELPPLILVQWRREKKYSICGNLRRALNKLVPLPEEIVEGHTNHTKSQKYCLQNVKKHVKLLYSVQGTLEFLAKISFTPLLCYPGGCLGCPEGDPSREVDKLKNPSIYNIICWVPWTM